MENKAKKKILIIVGVILVIIAIMTIIASSLIDDGEPIDKPNNGTNTTLNKKIQKLTDEALFFSVQRAINDYYIILTNNNASQLYNILEADYILENNITKSNVLNKIEHNYSSTSYIAKEIYYNPNSSVTYYFVNGYFIDTSMNEDDLIYYENVNYLIIVDSDSEYVIRPLNSKVDLNTYAKSYSIDDVDIDNESKFILTNINEKNKLTVYLNEFLNLMFFDTDRAYDMLDNSVKNNYNGFNDFKNQITDIYDKLSSSIFSYSTKEVGNIIEYNIVDNKQNKIKILEYNVMDYKVIY